MKKRLISLLLAFSMMLTFLPAGAVSAFAEENLGPYACGQNVTATLSRNNDGEETYTLTISGTGPMKNYNGYKTESNYAPWYEKIPNITRLIVEDGVTTLGDDILSYSYYDSYSHSHYFHPDLREVKLPDGLTYIGKGTFHDSPYLTEVKIPSTVTKIKGGAFSGCTGLTKIELPPQLEEVDGRLFYGCSGLTEITIPSSVKTIGAHAFLNCTSLESVTLSEGLREIESEAFQGTNLKSLNIPKSVEKLGYAIVDSCENLAYITIEPPSQLKETEPDYWFGGVFGKYNSNTDVYCEPRLRDLLDTVYENVGFVYTVDVTLVDGDTRVTKPIDYGAKITALDKDKPTKQGYTFTGWYTDADCKTRYPETQLFTNINGTMLYAGWATSDLTVKNGTISVIASDGTPLNVELKNGKAKVPAGATVTVTFDRAAAADNNLKFVDWKITGLNDDEKPQDTSQEEITFTVPADRDAIEIEAVCKADKYPLSVTGGNVTVEKGGQTLDIVPVEDGDKKTYSVPDGAKVTVTLDKTQIPEGMVFDIWTTGSFSLPSEQNYKAETITFTMSESVDIAAQYRDATIEDDGSTVLGTAAIIGTAVVGTMVLGYQAYSLGTEFAGYLMDLPYFPANRSALAVMLWEDAGKPMPESEQLYPDVGQEEQDMDLQHAARWAMENDLIPDRNEEGTAPEEMKFYPDHAVTRIDALNAWQKAQELKKNA